MSLKFHSLFIVRHMKRIRAHTIFRNMLFTKGDVLGNTLNHFGQKQSWLHLQNGGYFVWHIFWNFILWHPARKLWLLQKKNYQTKNDICNTWKFFYHKFYCRSHNFWVETPKCDMLSVPVNQNDRQFVSLVNFNSV